MITIPCDEKPLPPESTRKGSLPRIALEQGVSFDDVQAFVQGQGGTVGQAADWYEALVAPPECNGPYENLTEALLSCCQRMRTDTVLDAALARSAAAREPQRSTVWWSGLLPRAVRP